MSVSLSASGLQMKHCVLVLFPTDGLPDREDPVRNGGVGKACKEELLPCALSNCSSLAPCLSKDCYFLFEEATGVSFLSHSLHMRALMEVCIVAAVRTPFSGFQGALASLPATQLGALAIRAALERAGLAPGAVQECIMGNVLSAGLGQVQKRLSNKAGIVEHCKRFI